MYSIINVVYGSHITKKNLKEINKEISSLYKSKKISSMELSETK